MYQTVLWRRDLVGKYSIPRESYYIGKGKQNSTFCITQLVSKLR